MRPTFHLSGDLGANGVTSAALAEFLRAHPGDVVLEINSPGGDAMEGAAMMSEIERHGRVTARVSGIAASAATLPMVAARLVIAHPAAVLMIHEPAVMDGGTADELRQSASVLDKLSSIYAAAYSRHTGHPVDRIAAWMRDETWLSAAEAVELRFADEIETGAATAAPVARCDYAKFRAAPTALVRLAKENGWATVSPEAKKVGA